MRRLALFGVSVPDGYTIDLAQLDTWPDISPDEMPWVQRVELIPATGAPQVLVDNADLIEQLVMEWNTMFAHVDVRPEFSCHDSGGGANADDSGCGCSTAPTQLGGLLAMIGIVLGLRRRHRP